jgi:hypothetical protein
VATFDAAWIPAYAGMTQWIFEAIAKTLMDIALQGMPCREPG